jgi:Asp-tRNA(Asn)/Glu-tRNA(Gln) amidotransferase A subunit family amidase
MQLVAAPYDEARLFAVAHAYEQSTSWGRQLPTAVSAARAQ